MSFRGIFILLNAILLLAFGFIVSLPLLLLGRQYTAVFAESGAARLLPIVVFGLALVALNAYFVRRWRLFCLLDDRNWAGAAEYLQQRVLSHPRPGGLHVRLLANTLLLSGRVTDIGPLERHVAEHRPRLHRRMLLHLVIPYLVDDPDEGVGFFAERAADARNRRLVRAWLLWDYAFCLIRAGQPTAAAEPLNELAVAVGADAGRRRPRSLHVVALLAVYATTRLISQPTPPDIGVASRQLRAALQASEGDPHAVVFAAVIAEAQRWLEGEQGEPNSD